MIKRRILHIMYIDRLSNKMSQNQNPNKQNGSRHYGIYM